MGTFLEELQNTLKAINPDSATFTINHVTKPNNVEKTALCIRQADSNIGCNYYLEELQRRYNAGQSIEEIAADIMNHCMTDSTLRNGSILTSLLTNLTSYEKVKEQISIRLLNLRKNNEYLADKVYFPFIKGDDSYELAICLYIRVPVGNDTLGSITVTKQLRSQWNISDDELLQNAMDSTMRNHGCKLKNIFEVISQLMETKDSFSDFMNPPEPSMYVLTNDEGFNGAATLVYPEKLREIADQLNSDLFIIPSSIHELILIPDDGTIQPDSILEMIIQVNSTEVAPSEVLSNKLFYFSRTNNLVTIVKSSTQED